MIYVLAGIVLVLGAGLAVFVRVLQRRHMLRWTPAYVWQRWHRPAPRPQEEIHLILCIADHYEPKAGGAPPEVARARVDRWVRDYPRLFARFRDSDGRPPRYSFFYPIEEYEAEYLDKLAELCRAGFGEVEIHLHHDRDTAEHLRQSLDDFKSLLAQRHGLLARRRDTGELAYGFIHGNWALCNSRPDGKMCGVAKELDILRETGCYADFTFPSAPHSTQPAKINSIYYARNHEGRTCSHHRGQDVGRGPQPAQSLMLVQGPLGLEWAHAKWGMLPHIENSCLQASQPPSLARLDAWLKARIQVPTRPDWFFVKLHAHGAVEECHDTLLGEPMVAFHEGLARRARENSRFHYHYVTAREMYNLIKAAEAGFQGSVHEVRDYALVSNLNNAHTPMDPFSRGACSARNGCLAGAAPAPSKLGG